MVSASARLSPKIPKEVTAFKICLQDTTKDSLPEEQIWSLAITCVYKWRKVCFCASVNKSVLRPSANKIAAEISITNGVAFLGAF